jgi:hypothetical protein
MNPSKSQPEWQAKIDHHLRALLERTRDNPEERKQVVNVLVRFSGSVTALEAQGIKLRTIAGDIATASITLLEIPRVANISQILFLELSHPLQPDSTR